jgi:uncharacterized protein (DUF302 family)
MSGITRRIPLSYEAVLAKLPGALASEGFGVLTEIDVQQTLHKKLGIEFRPYKILGACNPVFAHRALEADLGAGVMLPCNVIVYADGHETVVVAVDPMETVAAKSEVLRSIAEEVRVKLQRVVEQL